MRHRNLFHQKNIHELHSWAANQANKLEARQVNPKGQAIDFEILPTTGRSARNFKNLSRKSTQSSFFSPILAISEIAQWKSWAGGWNSQSEIQIQQADNFFWLCVLAAPLNDENKLKPQLKFHKNWLDVLQKPSNSMSEKVDLTASGNQEP